MSQTQKVIAMEADLATFQRIGKHQLPLFWVDLRQNAENDAVEKEEKKGKLMQKLCQGW